MLSVSVSSPRVSFPSPSTSFPRRAPPPLERIDSHQGNATISNDGATILKLLDIVHPAARTLVDIARAQDAEVGDGTTSVVLLASEILKEIKGFVEDGVGTWVIQRGLREGARLAVEKINEIAVAIDKSDPKYVPPLPSLRRVLFDQNDTDRRTACLYHGFTGSSGSTSSFSRPRPCRPSSSTRKSPSSRPWSSTPSCASTRRTSTRT